ncbi:MAG: hypothetical protein JO099_13185 [Acidobacteriia bacterium]|nr:hypothetical protein [Terriglobia bacterium]
MQFPSVRLCLCASLALEASFLARAEPGLDQGYRQMYNLDFEGAHRTFAEWQRAHPNDPLAPASDAAAYLFSEFDRLHILQSEFFVHEDHFYTDRKLTPDPTLKQNFETAITRSIGLADLTPEDPNSKFAELLAHGLRSDYLGLIEKRYAAAFKEMKVARGLSEQLLAAHPEYADAWIAVGVENYMLSVKPAPVRWLLRIGGGETDRSLGIEKLRITAEKGHYLAPFARLLLAVAALRDHAKEKARDILQSLAREYPRNPLYAQELARLGNF